MRRADHSFSRVIPILCVSNLGVCVCVCVCVCVRACLIVGDLGT